jgi:hypothetical protein
MINKLSVLPMGGARVKFVCPECLVVPEEAVGAQNRAELVYLWICPQCQKLLAEWLTIQERDRELLDLAKRV